MHYFSLLIHDPEWFVHSLQAAFPALMHCCMIDNQSVAISDLWSMLQNHNPTLEPFAIFCPENILRSRSVQWLSSSLFREHSELLFRENKWGNPF